MIDLLLINASELLTIRGSKQPHRGKDMMELGIIQNGAIAIKDGIIADLGQTADLVKRYKPKAVYDASGKTVMPGFVDPHTHPVFVHTRENEFAMRLAGRSYVQIATAGGGIRSSIKTTRDANPETLFELAEKRIRKMIQLGTTTLEAKSGYGLTTESELKQLEVIAKLNKELPVDITATFMGAHEFPEEYKNSHSAYIDVLTKEMIPAVAEQGIAKYCDIFCEAHVYSLIESRQVLSKAREYGLELKMHADEIEPMGGAELAAKLRCISADHLGAASDNGILEMGKANVIPVLLPATLFSLRSMTYARARYMIDNGLPVAVATDYNPGSCNCDSMPLTIALSCLQMGMMPEEAITAATINAAFAIGMENQVGSLEIGKQADILIWDIPSYNFIPYHLGSSHLVDVFKNGKSIN